MSKDIKAYRLSKIPKDYKTTISGEVEHVLAFPNYKVIMLFDTGDIVKWDAKSDKEEYHLTSDEKDIKQPFAFNDDTICYISTVHKRLRLYNHQTKAFSNFSAEGGLLPTIQCLPEAERNAEKLEDIYRDGIKLAYLPETQQVVSLEMKNFLNTNSNDNVITIFQKDQNANIHQTVFTEPNHKQLQISALNKKDKVAVWGQCFENNPIKFFFWNISKGKDGIKTGFTLAEKCDKGKGVCVLNVFPWKENEIVLFGNYNEGDYPWMKVASVADDIVFKEGSESVQEVTTDLNLFPKQPNEEDNAWMLHDVLFCDYEQQKVLWERKNAQGSYLDVYHPNFKNVTFSDFEPDGGDEDDEDEDFEDDIVSLYKVVSSDGKYLLGYNPDREREEGQPLIVPFEVKSVVSLAASLFNILNKSGVVQKYTKVFAQRVINMLLKA